MILLIAGCYDYELVLHVLLLIKAHVNSQKTLREYVSCLVGIRYQVSTSSLRTMVASTPFVLDCMALFVEPSMMCFALSLTICHPLSPSLRMQTGNHCLELQVYGFSYGTAVMGTYATVFPLNVNLMVLDSNMPPNYDVAQFSEDKARSTNARIDYFIASCQWFGHNKCPVSMFFFAFCCFVYIIGTESYIHCSSDR